jgi:molybdopterin-guanine dinucleotide biosynthesis protein A
MIPIDDITGLVLAGGRGSRMGGVDKGLQNHQGMPLALHALLRLGLQVGQVMVNANRNLGAYESLGAPVWPDAVPDYPGPLAGFLAGLQHCETPYMVTVPCDSPRFPLDLVPRLAQVLVDHGAQIAMAVTLDETGERQRQPVFCLMHTDVLGSLVQFIRGGQRRIDRWTDAQRCVEVLFEDSPAFFNANTLQDLRQLDA